MQNILALDIDDCIFPSDVTYFGLTDDSVEMLEINLRRIIMMLNKYEMEVFITSSWSTILEFNNNTLTLNRQDEINKRYYKKERLAFNLLKQYLEPYIIGLSCGNRDRDIEKLLLEGNKVISFDDYNLSHIKHTNHLYVYVKGFVDGNVSYRVKNFLEVKVN